MNNTPLLLRLIDANQDISVLVHDGVSFTDIGALVAAAIESDLVQSKDGQLVLTPAGRKLSLSTSSVGFSSEHVPIHPMEGSRSGQVSQNEIYLPKLRNSFFNRRG